MLLWIPSGCRVLILNFRQNHDLPNIVLAIHWTIFQCRLLRLVPNSCHVIDDHQRIARRNPVVTTDVMEFAARWFKPWVDIHRTATHGKPISHSQCVNRCDCAAVVYVIDVCRRIHPGHATPLLALIRQLYDLEDRAKGWTTTDRQRLREQQSQLILDQIKQCTVSEVVAGCSPKAIWVNRSAMSAIIGKCRSYLSATVVCRSTTRKWNS